MERGVRQNSSRVVSDNTLGKGEALVLTLSSAKWRRGLGEEVP